MITKSVELKMNDSKQWIVSINPPRLLAFYCLCLSFLTACNQDSPSNNDTSPSVDLGPDLTVDIGDPVHLTPTIKDLDTNKISYLWIQTSGNPISLPDNNSPYITFTPLINDLLEFELTVTDNQDQEYRDDVSVTVLPENGKYTAQLNWTAPTENEDGSTLRNLAGYKIYYGQSITNLDVSIIVNNPLETSFDIKKLDPDSNYFFCISAYNTVGSESKCSDTVSI
jgi:hypothetical protein